MIKLSLCRGALLALPLMSACAATASGNASLQAGAGAGVEQGLDVDAEVDAEASADGQAPGAGLRLEIRIEKRGDELVQEGGEINFAYDAATLEGEATFATLQAYADLLARYPEVTLRIEGHTDSRGAQARNRELSERRAEAVVDWLVAHGIARERLEAVGLGEDRAKVPEPPACRDKKAATAPEWCEAKVWAANRRSEFHIVEGGETLPDGDLTAAAAEAPGRANGGDRPEPGADRSGAYVYASPGLISVPLSSSDSADPRAVSYRWGLGVGYLWRRDKLAVGLGLGVSHVPIALAPNSPRCEALACVTASDLTLSAALRLGGGSPRLIGYALVAPSLALGLSYAGGTRHVAPGFAVDLGLGLWGWVWRGLFVGGEALVTPAVYADRVGAFHGGERNTALGLRVLLGWQFGWRGRG